MNRLFLVRYGGSTANDDPSYYAFNDSAKPGNFNLEVYASEYSRTQQTARICLDQHERTYGLLPTPRHFL